MITAIDFGCYGIRSARRDGSTNSRITIAEERSEYVVIPRQEDCIEALNKLQAPVAECDDALVVFGTNAAKARWLSRKPAARLFTDAEVPNDDPPARQILYVLTEALLATNADQKQICCFTAPGGQAGESNVRFLERLIRMTGSIPLHCHSSSALMLAGGNETRFTGISIACGAETTEISIHRYGLELASETICQGANQIDEQIAKQFQMHVWDDAGDCYLDIEAVRDWKHSPDIHLRSGVSERERLLSRLYGDLLGKVAVATRNLLKQPQVQSALGDERLGIICGGGPTLIGGFCGALTERLVEQEVASRLLSVRVVEDSITAVSRGLLIQAELELRRARRDDIAA